MVAFFPSLNLHRNRVNGALLTRRSYSVLVTLHTTNINRTLLFGIDSNRKKNAAKKIMKKKQWKKEFLEKFTPSQLVWRQDLITVAIAAILLVNQTLGKLILNLLMLLCQSLLVISNGLAFREA